MKSFRQPPPTPPSQGGELRGGKEGARGWLHVHFLYTIPVVIVF
jgi:hypothetical protein